MAQDLHLDSTGTFLIGTFGLSQEQTTLVQEEDTPSWAKAETRTEVGAREGQVTPFGIDLRDDRRWSVIAPSGHSAQTIAFSLPAALTRTLEALRVQTAPWNVDLVYSKSTILEWVREHREVREFIRIVKRPNPVRDVGEDIQELNAINAARKAERFTARRGGNLRLLDLDDNLHHAFEGLLNGSELGYVEIRMEARGRTGTYKYRAEEYADHVFVDGFGTDLQRGMATVLDALREYSERRGAAEASP